MPGGPCWADCCNFLHVGWHPRRNHAYQILSRSSRGLRSYGGPKSAFSYMHFWTALTTVLRTTVLHCDYYITIIRLPFALLTLCLQSPSKLVTARSWNRFSVKTQIAVWKPSSVIRECHLPRRWKGSRTADDVNVTLDRPGLHWERPRELKQDQAPTAESATGSSYVVRSTASHGPVQRL